MPVALPNQKLSPATAPLSTAVSAQAISLFRQALELQGRKRDLEAARQYARALQIQPDFYEAAFNLGLLLHKTGQIAAAVECYRRAGQLRSESFSVWTNLGAALRELGRPLEAIESLSRALRLRPGAPSALNNLGNALRGAWRYEEAIGVFRQAVARDPANAGIWENLGNALRENGRLGEAEAALRQALRLRPDFVEGHWDLAFTLLMQGDLAQGFTEYEWRWRLPDFPGHSRSVPLWEGQELSGRTLLVQAEQGAGDAIQFVRFLPQLSDRGARVVLECSRALAGLFRAAPGVAEIVVKGEPLPHCDYHLGLLSLPHRLSVTLETLQAPVRYLQAPAERLSLKLPPPRTGAGALKVGLVWQGNAEQKNDRQRSCPPQMLEPLLDVSGVAFYSLQMPTAVGLDAAVKDKVTDLSVWIHDYADTARLLEQLDLLITVDTSVAHLAGALGRPVWVLLCFAPCWRWMLDRAQSPWYPTMRLFRQPAPGDWPSVVKQVHAALEALAAP